MGIVTVLLVSRLRLLVLALRLTAVSGASLAQLSYAAHAATPAVRPRLSFRTLLLAGIVHFGALSNNGVVAPIATITLLLSLRWTTTLEQSRA